jgi:hypothetical protein
MHLSLNGQEIDLVHPAGAHTDGDTVVIFTNAKVVAMGDVFFPDRFPYVDPDSGGRVGALVAAIDDFVRTWPEDMRIVPGHGRSVCSMVDVRAYQGMLHESLAWVGAGRRAGLSMDGLVARGAPVAYKAMGLAVGRRKALGVPRCEFRRCLMDARTWLVATCACQPPTSRKSRIDVSGSVPSVRWQRAPGWLPPDDARCFCGGAERSRSSSA